MNNGICLLCYSLESPYSQFSNANRFVPTDQRVFHETNFQRSATGYFLRFANYHLKVKKLQVPWRLMVNHCKLEVSCQIQWLSSDKYKLDLVTRKLIDWFCQNCYWFWYNCISKLRCGQITLPFNIFWPIFDHFHLGSEWSETNAAPLVVCRNYLRFVSKTVLWAIMLKRFTLPICQQFASHEEANAL